MSGVFPVGGSVSRIVIKKTVIESKAEIPNVTFSPESGGTKKTRSAKTQTNKEMKRKKRNPKL